MSNPARPGPRNLITDVAGLRVGQAQDPRVATGVTVILTDRPATAAVDVRGGAPGTRETDLLSADTLVEGVDAITLSGGSVYGLATADGVVSWLASRGRGFSFRATDVTAPIVPGAILFDLANGGDKGWGLEPPYRSMGIVAAETAGDSFALGAHGAGFGAQAGAFQGGIGSASILSSDGVTVGAIVAVNSVGAVVGADGRFFAAPFEIDGEYGGLGPSLAPVAPERWPYSKFDTGPTPEPRTNTTVACVATDAILTKGEARRVAIMAQDGLARAIRPVNTLFDGDVVFALATGHVALAEPRALSVTRIGALAADVLSRAVARGVYEAQARPNGPRAWRDHGFPVAG